MPERKQTAPSTQKNIPISEIKENVAIMNDGSMISVLLVSSINFYLKSEDEQRALVSGYVQFLNSIDFTLQILVQSRKLNIEGYLATIKEAERKQKNELLKMQTADYREFVAELVELADIMSKKFFIVVSYAPTKSGKKNFYNRFMEVVYPASKVKLNDEKFEKYKIELDRRIDLVTSGLGSIGLTTAPLDTQSLIELYYDYFNPVVSAKERLADLSKINVE